MTISTLALGYGLVARVEEGETDRPTAPPKDSTAHHDWTTCVCKVCTEWRQKAATMLPLEGTV